MQIDSNKTQHSTLGIPSQREPFKMSIETIKVIEEKLAKNRNHTGPERRKRTGSFFDDGCPDVALKSLFRKYDVNRDGQLSRDEIQVLFKEDLGLTDEQSEVYLYILDQDDDGTVSWDEFLFWMRSKERLQNVTDQVRYKLIRQALDLFQSYDRDHNFSLDKEELKTVLINSGGNAENIEIALQQLDKDHNGNVSFLEFLGWLNWIPTGQLFFEHIKEE
uniref:EF-hand domain-containing protein n=1 Tax=Clytia hemisphaerica TaxID=252671 RepID=A0A7M5WYH6_9CNID|eukprot:TCONS_00030447-protein